MVALVNLLLKKMMMMMMTFSTNPFHRRFILPTGLPHDKRDWTGPIMLIILFLVLHFNFLFVPCGRLSWLPVSFLLHVKHILSYRIVSYRSRNVKLYAIDDAQNQLIFIFPRRAAIFPLNLVKDRFVTWLLQSGMEYLLISDFYPLSTPSSAV